jgi:hypothetical protein
MVVIEAVITSKKRDALLVGTRYARNLYGPIRSWIQF